MKRSEFLKKLGIGLGVAVIAPAVVANNETTEDNPTRTIYIEGDRVIFKAIDYSKTIPSYRNPETGANEYVSLDNAQWNYMNEKCAKALIEEYKKIGLFDLP